MAPLLLLGLLPACAGGETNASAPPAPAPEPVRSALLGGLPAAGLERGVWVLTPADATYPGSPLDALVPTERAALLVEAPGPLALLSGVPTSARVVEPARRVASATGDVVLLAAPGTVDDVAARLGERAEPPAALARLAATTAPTAWAGRTTAGATLVTEEEDRLQVEVDGGAEALAGDVRDAVATGTLPGSPGRRWSDLLDDVRVEERDGRVVLTARTTAALPPTLLRQLVESAALPPR